MSANLDDNKPPVVVQFTKQEMEEINKLVTQTQQKFMATHPEIMAPDGNDLTIMIRNEKQMYARLGIMAGAIAFATTEKLKRT